MSNEYTSDNIDRVKEGSKMWEGGIGRSRFRALWDRGPGYAQFHFQGPFTQTADPDGIGVPFSSDLGIAWEKEHGARIYGEYWTRANRSIHEAAEQAQRALRDIPDDRLRSVGRELRTIAEKALVDLEESIANLRRKRSTNQSESQAIKKEQGLKAQRIPIEYDQYDDPFDDDSEIDSMDPAFPKSLAKAERDVRRRAILEDLRAGSITIEEAELRLMNLY